MVYLNCAVVPRHKRLPGRGNRVSHFVLVEMKNKDVTKAENVWLGQDEQGSIYPHHTDSLISSEQQGDMLVRTVFNAFDSSHNQFRTKLHGQSRRRSGGQEL